MNNPSHPSSLLNPINPASPLNPSHHDTYQASVDTRTEKPWTVEHTEFYAVGLTLAAVMLAQAVVLVWAVNRFCKAPWFHRGST